MSTIAPAVALAEALRLIIRDEIAAALGEASRPTEVYSQRELPPWARSVRVYLREWRGLKNESHPGATAAGRMRLMSRAASDEIARRLDARGRRRPAPPESGASILEALGAERRSR